VDFCCISDALLFRLESLVLCSNVCNILVEINLWFVGGLAFNLFCIIAEFWDFGVNETGLKFDRSETTPLLNVIYDGGF
jgi:hypothetical protein